MRHRTAHTGLGAAVLVAATIALAGCQTPTDQTGDSRPPDPSVAPSAGPSPEPTTGRDDGEDPPAGQVEVDLTVRVDATGEGATTEYTLTCAPTGGDHPDAEAACAAIAAGGGAEAFAPTPRDVACTEQWGGPQTATVNGTVGSSRVDAQLDRHNGCEIARWDALAALFGPDAGLL